MVDETMQSALLLFKRQHSQSAMRALLEEVAGVSAISQVPDSKVEAVIAACESDWKPGAKAKAKAVDLNDPAYVQGVYARWNGI